MITPKASPPPLHQDPASRPHLIRCSSNDIIIPSNRGMKEAVQDRQRQDSVASTYNRITESVHSSLCLEKYTRMASRTLQTRYSLVTFLNSTTQWTKAETAIKPWLAGVVITSEDSVCAHTIRQKNKIFLVEDLSKDPRFCDKKYVTHYPYMRFYAGVPLKLKTSPVPIGALCVLDTVVRSITPGEIEGLQILAEMLCAELDWLYYQHSGSQDIDKTVTLPGSPMLMKAFS